MLRVNPPVTDEPEDVLEAKDQKPPTTAAGRRSFAERAALEVRRERIRAERQMLKTLLERLARTKREIQRTLLAGATDFRRFVASSLLSEIDQILAETREDLSRLGQLDYQRALSLGSEQVDAASRAAALRVHLAPALDTRLVTAAYENTVDLLSDAMTQFRSRIAVAVRRLASSGDNFGDALVKLSRTIGREGWDMAEYRAERILRTELSRTFNSATHGRLVALAEKSAGVRKIWIATKDDRTRETHTEAAARYHRGAGIPVDERFLVGRTKLRFPVDPLAEGPDAASQVIMCRCNMAMALDLTALAADTTARVRLAMSGG